MTKTIKTTDQVETPQVDEEEVATPPSPHTVEVGTEIRSRSSFGKTYYFLDLGRDVKTKGPNQMLGILRWMKDNEVTSASAAMQGAEIGRRAVEDGYVVTQKLTGQVIFAYYIRRMERDHGIEHAKTTHAKTGKIMA